MMQDLSNNPILPNLVLDFVNAGVYVTDLERRIIYWNDAACPIHTRSIRQNYCPKL
jgi:hypothetical protein